MQVVAILFPETGSVLALHGKSPYPFGALPEIEMRHQEARRSAVFGLELVAVELIGDPSPTIEEVLQRKVCAVATEEWVITKSKSVSTSANKVSSDTPLQPICM